MDLSRYLLGLSLTLLVGSGLGCTTTEAQEEDTLLEHDGIFACGDLTKAKGELSSVCKADAQATKTIELESETIQASPFRVLSALLDAEEFGALPRPAPPGAMPPPGPHSVRTPAADGSPFLDHYRLFYGALSASTVSVDERPDGIEVVQLWRIEMPWSEHDLKDGYPDMSDEELQAKVGTPIMDQGLHTKVTFSIRDDGDGAKVSLVQSGVPPFNYPVFQAHWQALYFQPMKAYLESQ